MSLLAPLFLALVIPAQDLPVLRGLDPVELCAGRELPGRPDSTAEREGLRYQFASDDNRARFEAEPERYAAQMGGGCGRMGPLSGLCSGDRFAVHEGRLYMFASDACRASFLKSPASHLDRDDPPLFEGEPDAAAVAAAQALLDKAIAGLGGGARVDAVRALRLAKRATETSGGVEHVLRDTWTWRLPDDLRHESAWDEWVWQDVVTAQDAYSGGKDFEPLSAAARRELRRQMGREPLWLLRQRGAEGFSAAAGGTETVGATAAEILRVRLEGTTTTFWLDPADGRILRAAWRGRLGTGANGDVVVDYSDFRESGGLLLPHAREVTFDRQRAQAASGTLESIEVDPEIPDAEFSRGA